MGNYVIILTRSWLPELLGYRDAKKNRNRVTLSLIDSDCLGYVVGGVRIKARARVGIRLGLGLSLHWIRVRIRVRVMVRVRVRVAVYGQISIYN
jgi:hypothetical protein